MGCNMDTKTKKVVSFRKVRRALRWLEDLENNTMKEKRAYNKTYMGYNSVSQDELDLICEVANKVAVFYDIEHRMGNSMGELRPGKRKPQIPLPLKYN